jgi:hypothetical protein
MNRIPGSEVFRAPADLHDLCFALCTFQKRKVPFQMGSRGFFHTAASMPVTGNRIVWFDGSAFQDSLR